MKDSIRLRLVGVGFAAAGLAVGTAIGAVAGVGLSPDEEVAATTTTAPPPTTTEPRPEIDPGDPLDLGTPLVTAIGVEPGAILSIQTSPETGTSLYRLGEQGVVSPIDLPYEGPIIGFGRAAVAIGTDTGVVVSPLDGGEGTTVGPATNASVLDSSLVWLDHDPGSTDGWTVWTVDLDTAGASPVAHSTLDLLTTTSFTPWVLHLDDRGAIVVTDRLWVVPADDEPWALDGPWPQAVLTDVLVVTEPPESDDGDWQLVTYDRRTGAVTGRVVSPLGGDCTPVDAAGDTIAWTCEGDLPFVTTADGSIERVAADWVELIDGGRTALWFGTGAWTGSHAVRITDLASGVTGTIRSNVPILRVLP